MDPIIKYGCCGNPYAHRAHWYVINSNPRAMMGAADYYCIGRNSINGFDEVRAYEEELRLED